MEKITSIPSIRTRLGSYNIRESTLLPAYNPKWDPPNPSEIAKMIDLTGLTDGELGSVLGLVREYKGERGNRTVRRWRAGDSKIPYTAWALMASLAGFGLIWFDVEED